MTETTEKPQKELLVLAIELGDQNKKYLKIFPDSKPEQLAYDFCLQNNLDFDSLQNLTEEIKNVLNNNLPENSEHKKIIAHKEKEIKEENAPISSKEEKIVTESEEKISNAPSEKKNLNININKNNENNEEKSNEKSAEKNSEKNTEKITENQIEEPKKKINPESENEEELAKEEEGDEIIDTNENMEEAEIPSYLAPTLSSQYKQRQIAPPKEKSDYPDFITSFKKNTKIENNENKNENEEKEKLIIYTENQKYLPKDYYDPIEGENFGDKLYHKELKLKEIAMEKTKNKIAMINKPKDDNCTFTPQINDYNLIALRNRRINKMSYNDEDKILYYKDYLQAKTENTKIKLHDELEKENTFAPKINKKSEKIEEAKVSNVPRYEKLYNTKVDLKELESKIYDSNMFKPKINKNYKGAGTKTITNLTFEERQKMFKNKVKEKNDKLKETTQANVDKKTGKKYFKPTINENKNKANEENKQKKDIKENKDKIFIDLYSDAQKNQIKKEELEKKVKELENFNTEFKASNKSKEMYDKQKYIAFAKLFKKLDDDRDGKISKDSLNINGISKRINKIIEPVLNDIQNNGDSLGLKEFSEKCSEIYKNLNYAEKKELFSFFMGGQKSVYDTDENVHLKKVQIKKGIYKKSKSNTKERVKAPKENMNSVDINNINNTDIINTDNKDIGNTDNNTDDNNKNDIKPTENESKEQENINNENQKNNKESTKMNNNVKEEKAKQEEKNKKLVEEVHVPFQEVHDYTKYRGVNNTRVKSGRSTKGKKHELFSKNNISSNNKRK